MVRDMGWYDNALEHSSGPWKKHKYVQKIGEGASAKYKYVKQAGKDTVGKLTGEYYESEANKHKKDADYYRHEASRHFDNAVRDAAKERTPEEEKTYDEYWRNQRSMMDADMNREIAAESAERKARRKAENAPIRKAQDAFEKAKKRVKKAKASLKHDDFTDPIERGQAIIDELLGR